MAWRPHGGYIPFGGTFLTFSDYSRNALRMAALMELRVIFVFTHDSIGLGEDGPTHQSVEHTASLRLIPNMWVWRPCDAVETAVAWQDAIERANGPTSLVLTRQALPAQARQAGPDRGHPAWWLRPPGCCPRRPHPDRHRARKWPWLSLLPRRSRRRATACASCPCPARRCSRRQDAAWRESVLPAAVTRRIAIEMGVTETWHRWVGPAGRIVGLDVFGKSAPAKDLFAYFGFTPERVVKEALELLGA